MHPLFKWVALVFKWVSAQNDNNEDWALNTITEQKILSEQTNLYHPNQSFVSSGNGMDMVLFEFTIFER